MRRRKNGSAVKSVTFAIIIVRGKNTKLYPSEGSHVVPLRTFGKGRLDIRVKSFKT
jgi:hypothetical protein